MEYLTLDKISAYQIALELSNYVWDIVVKWDWFPKKTVGAQWVESTDSISANIAEGFGRYFKKDKIKFYRYSQGSLQESMDWFSKSKTRNLLTVEQIDYLNTKFEVLPKELNNLISYTDKKLKY